MLELKVRKIGNSLGVVFEGAYQLTAYDPASKKRMAKAEDIIRRYRRTLHALAN